MATLYRKTEKGSAEIATRANRLVPRLRAALIVVDGRRGFDELCKLIPGSAEEALLTLEEAGYIEPVNATALRPSGAFLATVPLLNPASAA
jgi:hypothetical protein